MTGYAKVSGTWTKVSPWGKSSGTWSKAKEAYANVFGTWKQWWLDGGVNDRTFTEFDVYNGFSGTVNAIAIQSDGKIVIGGSYLTFNGVTVNRIVRLNSDGTRDTAFTTNTGTAFNSNVNAIAIQSDGKIVCSGFFTTFNGTTVNRIVRLNSDGTRDTAFTLFRGTASGTNLGESSGFCYIYSVAGRVLSFVNMNYLDSPSTTSAQTYTAAMYAASGTTAYAQRFGTKSTMTLMEIAG